MSAAKARAGRVTSSGGATSDGKPRAGRGAPVRSTSRAVGIDLGTSNSVVAVIDKDGAPRILTTSEGGTTLPSLVWFSPDGPVVGERAREGLDESPDQTIFGAKRLLGRRFDHPEIRRLARVLPFELVEAPNGDTWISL
jgi:molecular chaperone DnaK